MCTTCGCMGYDHFDQDSFHKVTSEDIIDQKITDAGYKFDKLENNIRLVYDFITDEEQKEIMNLAGDPKLWGGWYLKHVEDRAEARYGNRNLEETKTEVTENWDDKIAHISEHTQMGSIFMERMKGFYYDDCPYDFRSFGIIQRMWDGVQLKAHYDQYVDMRMAWAAVLYVNDDYNGGEIFFTFKNIEIRPPAKSLLIFPTWQEYHHGVRHVTDGPIRYVMPAFIWSEVERYDVEWEGH